MNFLLFKVSRSIDIFYRSRPIYYLAPLSIYLFIFIADRIYICCEHGFVVPHGKKRAICAAGEGCKPARVSANLFKLSPDNAGFDYNYGLVCNDRRLPTNLPAMPKGKPIDRQIVNRMIAFLIDKKTPGASPARELAYPGLELRIERMKNVLFQVMYIPKWKERLKRLVPVAYTMAALIVGRRNDAVANLAENLRDKVFVIEDALKVQMDLIAKATEVQTAHAQLITSNTKGIVALKKEHGAEIAALKQQVLEMKKLMFQRVDQGIDLLLSDDNTPAAALLSTPASRPSIQESPHKENNDAADDEDDKKPKAKSAKSPAPEESAGLSLLPSVAYTAKAASSVASADFLPAPKEQTLTPRPSLKRPLPQHTQTPRSTKRRDTPGTVPTTPTIASTATMVCPPTMPSKQLTFDYDNFVSPLADDFGKFLEPEGCLKVSKATVLEGKEDDILMETLETGSVTYPMIGPKDPENKPPPPYNNEKEVRELLPHFRQSISKFGSGSKSLNEAVMAGVDPFSKMGQTAFTLQSALGLLKNFQGPVYRGMQHTEAFIQQMLLTKVVVSAAFLSTSIGGVHHKFYDRNCHLVIESKSGKSIASFVKDECYKNESEVLFIPGVMFDVLKIVKAEQPWKEEPCYIIYLVERDLS